MELFNKFVNKLYALKIPCKVKLRVNDTYVVELGRDFPDHLMSKIVDAAYELDIPYDNLVVCAEQHGGPMVKNMQVLCGGPKDYSNIGHKYDVKQHIKNISRGKFGSF